MRVGILTTLLVLLLARPAWSVETRCGWLANLTPQDLWLTDRHATWNITSQGRALGPDAKGVQKVPAFGTSELGRFFDCLAGLDCCVRVHPISNGPKQDLSFGPSFASGKLADIPDLDANGAALAIYPQVRLDHVCFAGGPHENEEAGQVGVTDHDLPRRLKRDRRRGLFSEDDSCGWHS